MKGFTKVQVDNNSPFAMVVLNRKILACTTGQIFSVPNPTSFFSAIDAMGRPGVTMKVLSNKSASKALDSGDDANNALNGGVSDNDLMLSELGLTDAILKALSAGGINSIEQLTDHTAETLNAIKDIGEKTVSTIAEALEKHSLSLKAGE